MTGSVVLGYDSYNENYSVLQVPALSKFSEFRTRLSLGYLHGNILKNFVRVEGQSLIGQESVETVALARLARRFGPTRLAIDNVVTYRSYRETTNYTFANDYLRYDLRGQASHVVKPGLSIAFTDRLEVIDFAERTDFDYDYVRNNIEVSANLDRGFTTGYQLSASYTRKFIPDSTEISYGSYAGGLEFRHSFGLQRQIFVAVAGERRLYEDSATRSPFWSLYSTATIQPTTIKQFGITFDNTFESYQYDKGSSVFFSYVENRSALLLTHFNETRYTIGLGPTYGFLTSGVSLEDEYTEVGGKLAIDYNSGGQLWISASYEPGRRDYKIDGSNPLDLVFSDFVYHRILLFATLQLWGNASLNTFINLEPEDHKLRDDDTTTTLISTDVTYRF